ncbi:MAG: adenylate/guanylate cyclase domain-containing protein [Desulfitobacteriaceae bacterium]
MEVVRNIQYDYFKSNARLDEILDSAEIYEEKDEIPSRTNLTSKNGFYVKCYSIFIDLRGSSELPNLYKRPTLAKIYRSYISEVVAIFNSYATCKEINIVGDCVSGIFEASKKEQVLDVFGAACTANSLVNILNFKLNNKKLTQIKIGIGISKGRALMIKAGFNGSAINDVIWMGDVVNQASKLCSKGNKVVDSPIIISNEVYTDLVSYNGYHTFFKCHFEGYYYANVTRKDMDEFIGKQTSELTSNKILPNGLTHPLKSVLERRLGLTTAPNPLKSVLESKLGSTPAPNPQTAFIKSALESKLGSTPAPNPQTAFIKSALESKFGSTPAPNPDPRLEAIKRALGYTP